MAFVDIRLADTANRTHGVAMAAGVTWSLLERPGMPAAVASPLIREDANVADTPR